MKELTTSVNDSVRKEVGALRADFKKELAMVKRKRAEVLSDEDEEGGRKHKDALHPLEGQGHSLNLFLNKLLSAQFVGDVTVTTLSVPGAVTTTAHIPGQIGSPTYEILVTHRNTRGFDVVGFVNGSVFTECVQIRGRGGDYLQNLTNFYILPTMRRQGHGTYLMGELVKLLRETGSTKLVVSNETSQGGVFYYKMGFRKNGVGDLWLHVGVKPEPGALPLLSCSPPSYSVPHSSVQSVQPTSEFTSGSHVP